MGLNVDLSALHAAVRRMGAELRDFDVGHRNMPLDSIDIQLERGIELPNLNDLEITNGLLNFQGRQILLYIQDQGRKIADVLVDGSLGRKFHVADCRTLNDMRRKGRFERYVVTNKLDGRFYVTGQEWPSTRAIEGEAELWVCQNCLKALNYKGAQHAKTGDVARSFSIEEFFSTYSSFFPHLPSREAGQWGDETYADNWTQISAQHKLARDYKCESCGVDLSYHKQLLHVHHRNGVKSDNSTTNLVALCADCHREQPHHGHMFVPHKDTRLINHLRRLQGLLSEPSKWEQVMKRADRGLIGLLNACREAGAPPPDIGVGIQDSRNDVVAILEVGWPRSKVGVAIGHEDTKRAQEHGWRMWNMFDGLNEVNRIVQMVRR